VNDPAAGSLSPNVIDGDVDVARRLVEQRSCVGIGVVSRLPATPCESGACDGRLPQLQGEHRDAEEGIESGAASGRLVSEQVVEVRLDPRQHPLRWHVGTLRHKASERGSDEPGDFMALPHGATGREIVQLICRGGYLRRRRAGQRQETVRGGHQTEVGGFQVEASLGLAVELLPHLHGEFESLAGHGGLVCLQRIHAVGEQDRPEEPRKRRRLAATPPDLVEIVERKLEHCHHLLCQPGAAIGHLFQRAPKHQLLEMSRCRTDANAGRHRRRLGQQVQVGDELTARRRRRPR
jgi:hypothetical protein